MANRSSGHTPLRRITAFCAHAEASPSVVSATGMVQVEVSVFPSASVTVRVAVSSVTLPASAAVTVMESVIYC